MVDRLGTDGAGSLRIGELSEAILSDKRGIQHPGLTSTGRARE